MRALRMGRHRSKPPARAGRESLAPDSGSGGTLDRPPSRGPELGPRSDLRPAPPPHGGLSAGELSEHSERIAAIVETASGVVLGKAQPIRLAVACMLARGHLLIEDVPGVGKTTMAQVLARAIGLTFQRIQFTNDLLPADILGVSVYNQAAGAFEFHPGPIFAQVVLADEVNRATPKTQSALLEAMEERQVTQDGQTRALPSPFYVVATQNPGDQVGTHALPESQLDRFLMRIELGYPDPTAERALLRGSDRRPMVSRVTAACEPDDFRRLQEAVDRVHASDAVLDYLQALLTHTRESGTYGVGLSPRAGLALLRAAQAWALVSGRAYLLPEDVQAVLPAVVGHRLRYARDPGEMAMPSVTGIGAALLREVRIP